MNGLKFLFASLILALTLTLAASPASGETRNLYVGDIFTLEIACPGYDETDVRQKFDGFEILDMKKTSVGYNLTLRTFDTGERIVDFDGSELLIRVHSTLDDFQRDTVFSGGSEIRKAGFPFYWGALLASVLCVFAFSGAFVILKAFRYKKAGQESHYRSFLRRSASLLIGDDNYLVDLTFYFKEYLGGLYRRRIIGKTSSEILRELTDIPALAPSLPFIQVWLRECDRYKFSGEPVSSDIKRAHYGKLLRIAEIIESGAAHHVGPDEETA